MLSESKRKGIVLSDMLKCLRLNEGMTRSELESSWTTVVRQPSTEHADSVSA